jgi:hypothetical protein
MYRLHEGGIGDENVIDPSFTDSPNSEAYQAIETNMSTGAGFPTHYELVLFSNMDHKVFQNN